MRGDDLEYNLSELSSFVLQLLYQGTVTEYDVAKKLCDNIQVLKLTALLKDIRDEQRKRYLV